MKIVFFGSSIFSKVILEEMIAQKKVPELVVTTPDRPSGRGLKTTPTPIKIFAQENKIKVISPENLKEEKVVEKIQDIKPQIYIIVSFGKIIPQILLDIPSILPLGIHPSLLPLYRGAAPINWVLINGEQETGTTIFKVNQEFDSGPIIFQERIKVAKDDDAVSLFYKLNQLSALATIKVINSIVQDDYSLTDQDSSKVSYAPKFKKADGKIDWSQDADKILNLIKGLRGWPNAFTTYKDGVFKIIKASISVDDLGGVPGEIVKLTKDSIYVGTAKGTLKIKELKPEGRTEMNISAFACGYQPKLGDKFF